MMLCPAQAAQAAADQANKAEADARREVDAVAAAEPDADELRRLRMARFG